MTGDNIIKGENGRRGDGNSFASGLAGMMPLTDAEFKAVRGLVHERFGINLTEQKRSLIVGRLQKLIRTMGFSTFGQYIEYVRKDSSGQALGELVNRMSTNFTYFFREKDHFEYFSKVVLPEVSARLKQRKSRDLRVWCAGCSTGEEAYTLLMLIMEHFGHEYNLWDAGLLATDISASALAKARAGVYPEEAVSLLPPNLKRKYFSALPGSDLGVNDLLKKELTFRRFNFMNPVFPFKNPFDIIFCRNVMIYFDRPTRDALVRRFYDFTLPGGYLFIGHSESLQRDTCPYDYVMPAVYRKGGK